VAKVLPGKQQTGDRNKPKHEKSHLTNKFKALLAANLKKHNLGKDIETKVQALYVTKPKRENESVQASSQIATTTSWIKQSASQPQLPPPFYERYVPLSKCEQSTFEKPTNNIYVRGRFYYDSVEDNPDYDYSWGLVRCDDIS